MKRIKYIVALIFIALFAITIGKPGFADSDTIEIKSAEDLHQLSIDASFDQWSIGKTVILEADIDLDNEEFTPIPIFSGTFDGNGHTISGLYIRTEGASQGFFRYLGESGYIKDLNLRGRVQPDDGYGNTVGGLVGYNEGTIENVSFTGMVKGADTVGGLVGFNGALGNIIISSFNGYIFGEREVGGIAGYNTGTILRSINKSDVNSIIDRNNQYYRDVGGIAGVNIGIIDESDNIGRVGYGNTGYNMGGIAGRQSGYISQSTNYGNVYGKKEVGGIVGKMEAYENLIIPPSKIEELKDEIERLETYIEIMISNADTSTSSLDRNLSELERNVSSSRTHLQTLMNLLEEGTSLSYHKILPSRR